MKSAKPNIGSGEEVTLSHIEKNASALRKRREDKRDKKRRPTEQITGNSILDLMKKLNYKEFMESPAPVDSLNVLDLLLKQKGISNYFGKCDKNKDGPFLFEDPLVLKRLVHLIRSDNQQVQIITASCLSNVACHKEPFLWVNRLVENGVLPLAFEILKKPTSSSKLRENLLWMIASIALDNHRFRDLLVNNGICQLVTELAMKESHENITFIATLAYLFRCLFYHEESSVPYPNPFWDFIILKLFNTFYSELPDPIVLDLLDGICSTIRANDDYRALFFKQSHYIMDLSNQNIAIINRFADICISLSRCIRIRPEASNALVVNFTRLLQQQNPAVRFQAAIGLKNLSVSAISLQHLCQEEVLKTLNAQLAYTSDVGTINMSLQYCICQMVICAAEAGKQNIVYPLLIEKLFIHLKLARILFIKGDDNILIKGLEAFLFLISWDNSIAEKLDDEVETQLDALATVHRLDEVNKLAEEALIRIKSNMEF